MPPQDFKVSRHDSGSAESTASAPSRSRREPQRSRSSSRTGTNRSNSREPAAVTGPFQVAAVGMLCAHQRNLPVAEVSQEVGVAPFAAQSAPALSAALLAETREELERLAKAADRAAAACAASAPLAEALREAVMRELALITSSRADLDDRALKQRIDELRASAAQGLELLQGALNPAAAEESHMECEVAPAAPSFAAAPGSLDSPQRGNASPKRVLDRQGMAPMAPRAASPLPCPRRRQLPGTPQKQQPRSPERAQAKKSPRGQQAQPHARNLQSLPSGPLSPPLAVTLGDVASDMRQALSEIRIARRLPREPCALSPLGGRGL